METRTQLKSVIFTTDIFAVQLQKWVHAKLAQNFLNGISLYTYELYNLVALYLFIATYNLHTLIKNSNDRWYDLNLFLI